MRQLDLDGWDMLPGQKKCWENDHSETILFSSGLGSGKSHVLVKKLIKYSVINKGIAGGLLVPNYSSFKRDIHPLMIQITEEMGLVQGKHWQYNQMDKTYKFIWSSAPLYVFTAENAIAGPNLGWGGINEHSLIQYERVKEFLRRIRIKNVPLKQKFMAGTPEDVFGWLEDFVALQKDLNEKNPNAFAIVYADTRENIFIDDAYRAHLEAMLDSEALRVFASGEIIRIGGNYFYYAFKTEKNVSDEAAYNPDALIYANLDFNVGRMAATLAHKHDAKTFHFFDEIYLQGNSGTGEMASAISSRFSKDKVILTLDASAKNRKTSGMSDVQILIEHGFKQEQIRYKRSNPKFRERQLLVNGKLDKCEILFNPKCKRTIRDIKNVQQNKATFEKDKTDLDLTHFSDTIDYLIDYEFSLYLARKSSTIEI